MPLLLTWGSGGGGNITGERPVGTSMGMSTNTWGYTHAIP